jgi:adenylate kinase
MTENQKPDPAALADGTWNAFLGQDSGAEKFGTNRRVVFVLTGNGKKIPEHRRNLERYGIEVFQAPPVEDPAFREALLGKSTQDVKVLAVIREESCVCRHGTDELSSLGHLDRVDNVSVLRVYRLAEGRVGCTEYRHRTEGYIDLTQRTPDPTDVFGWDDVFVVKNTGQTYHQLAKRGHKISSRDMVISAFLRDHVYYKEAINLRFNPQEQARPIDFGNSVAAFVRRNPHLNNEAIRRSPLAGLFPAVVNEGVFFRAPVNRREKNYWLPGLNAGIPFVPKKDAIHEITYMAHDFGHFLIPDLVFTGDTSPAHRTTYVAYRMMSEAITLVLADMLFVDTLRRSGHPYDYSRRQIYPLFEDLGLDFSGEEHFVADLELLLKANVRYCLRGDDSGYRELLRARGKDDANLERFKAKYMPFFVEDFRWTERNWSNMAPHAELFRAWWQGVSPLRGAGGLRLETVDEFVRHVEGRGGDVVDRVFDRVFRTIVRPVFQQPVTLVSPEEQLGKAFFKYTMGQMGLFTKYNFLPEASVYQMRVRDYLLQTGPRLDLETVNRVRGFYEQFVDVLVEKSLISLDDALTCKEVYPLYPPFYVFYDGQEGFYPDLARVSRRILFDETGCLS